MSFKFTDKEFQEIEKVLEAKFAKRGQQYRAVLLNSDQGRKLSIEIFPDLEIGKQKGNLISVYTPSSHLQLHFCTGYVASEMLGEVTFFTEHEGRLSGIVIEKQAACSSFTNVDSGLLSGDFDKLSPEVMLSGIALSLVEPLLEKKNSK
jgi:hypothetical protein